GLTRSQQGVKTSHQLNPGRPSVLVVEALWVAEDIDLGPDCRAIKDDPARLPHARQGHLGHLDNLADLTLEDDGIVDGATKGHPVIHAETARPPHAFGPVTLDREVAGRGALGPRMPMDLPAEPCPESTGQFEAVHRGIEPTPQARTRTPKIIDQVLDMTN